VARRRKRRQVDSQRVAPDLSGKLTDERVRVHFHLREIMSRA
jgi:hypothetical protein